MSDLDCVLIVCAIWFAFIYGLKQGEKYERRRHK